MALEKQLMMIQALLRNTKSGRLEWRETGDSDAFQALFSGTSFILRKQKGQTNEPDYQGIIVNEQGNVAESFMDTDFASEGRGPEAYNAMHELFDLARRKVLGVDRIIDSILKELGDD
jgi:hypothetical protein